ncbi:MAG: 5-formyltetrahydrofolate cyclo-ligase [Staphylothermus sp.]|nr:5-formyltetrahydrofolate cyclo-ligase [Staphylothermus sp.]
MIDSNKIKEEKQRIRKMIWDLMEKYNIARFPRPVHGRIPNFVGAEVAAERITNLDIWVNAHVVKANPDSPQKPLRYRALYDGKVLVMASPKLREGFILLDPSKIPPSKYTYASTIRGAFIYGKKVSLKDIPCIDLVVTGSVAVDRRGGRIGKGGGYAELEYAILREIGSVTQQTPVVTTVHDIQIVDQVPLEPHDLTVDYIGTPKRLYKISPRPPKPKGIYWELLGDKIKLKVIQELIQYLKK